MDEMQAVEALIHSETRIAVIDTDDHDRVIDWLRKLFNLTGKASYVWQADHGLQRIAIEHVPIPGTQRPLEVLQHILASHHFGIYLLRDFQKALSEPSVCARIEDLMNSTEAARKLVLLVGRQHKLPSRLAPRIEQITLI